MKCYFLRHDSSYIEMSKAGPKSRVYFISRDMCIHCPWGTSWYLYESLPIDKKQLTLFPHSRCIQNPKFILAMYCSKDDEDLCSFCNVHATIPARARQAPKKCVKLGYRDSDHQRFQSPH